MNDLLNTTWKIDQGHSAIQFKIQHLAIARVSGEFSAFTGAVKTDQDDFAGAQVQLEIAAASLNTNHERRDAFLKSDGFFDVERFPTLTFDGRLQKTADTYALTGVLTLFGVSQQVTLPAAYTGTGQGLRGDIRAGFEVTGRLNRADFGLGWNLLTEIGSLVIGEEVHLQMDIELIKDEVEATAEAVA